MIFLFEFHEGAFEVDAWIPGSQTLESFILGNIYVVDNIRLVLTLVFKIREQGSRKRDDLKRILSAVVYNINNQYIFKLLETN